MKHYLITGRVVGHDEDSTEVYATSSELEARELFISEMRSQSDPDDEQNMTVFINTVAEADAPIRILQRAPV